MWHFKSIVASQSTYMYIPVDDVQKIFRTCKRRLKTLCVYYNLLKRLSFQKPLQDEIRRFLSCFGPLFLEKYNYEPF